MTVRVFVAIELPPNLHQRLRELVDRLRRSAADVRWVRPEGTHLTLKFIGELPEEKLPSVKEALAQVKSPGPVEMTFRGIGYFPSERRPRVIWVGVEASANLASLAAQVEDMLEPLGVAREKRAFSPHLTLGRIKGQKGLSRLREEAARLPSVEFGQARATEFTLFQSRLRPQGAEYLRLATFPWVRE